MDKFAISTERCNITSLEYVIYFFSWNAYLTSSLQVVIPTQFVMFNLTAIVGSAILYRDFDKINFHRFLTFFYGCMTTFLGTSPASLTCTSYSRPILGVYLLTRSSPPPSESATSATSPTQSQTPTQSTPLLPKSPSLTRSSSLATKRITRRSSVTSLNIVGLSPGPYLLLATPGASPGVVAVPVRDGNERAEERRDRRERSRSRSTARGAGR